MSTVVTAAAIAVVVAGCADDPQKPPVDPCADHPCDVAAVVTHLRGAYAGRDYARLTRLLHDDYSFILHADPNDVPPPPANWGKQEELRIHQRMFDPMNIQPDQLPLDPNLWLVSVNAAFTPRQTFQETHEYDQSQANPEGLDPQRWKVWSADYDASALFDTRGETDYFVDGRAVFVVVQDLAKAFGEPGEFMLYRWLDRGVRPRASTSVEPTTWTQLKGLYTN